MSCTLLVCKVLIQCQGHHIEAPVGHTVNGTLAVANVARLIRATATPRPCFCSLPAMSDLKMPWAVGRESVVRIIVCTALAPRTRWGDWRQTPFRHLEGRYEVSIGLRGKTRI